MLAVKMAQAERGASIHIPITHLNSPTVFECGNGQVGSTIICQGVPFDTANNDALNR